MKNLRPIVGAALLTVALSTSSMAGNIGGMKTTSAGNIGGLRTSRTGNIGGMRTDAVGNIGGLRTTASDTTQVAVAIDLVRNFLGILFTVF